ncbi:MAG: FAD-binding oxidoreductase [Anaerotignum sp.]|nr:FAD-binding oxidoreductase [Anaerotignum sp.]
MDILMGITYSKGTFPDENKNTVAYETLYAEYISDECDVDEKGCGTAGWKCGSMKLALDVEVKSAPDLASLLNCPVYFVIDPTTTGFNSRGQKKIPTVSTIIKAGEPQTIVPPGSSLGATEGNDHHGVGMKLGRLMKEQYKDNMVFFEALKKELDPNGIMNPYKLGL